MKKQGLSNVSGGDSDGIDGSGGREDGLALLARALQGGTCTHVNGIPVLGREGGLCLGFLRALDSGGTGGGEGCIGMKKGM